jgi:hypothetical protein
MNALLKSIQTDADLKGEFDTQTIAAMDQVG